MIKHYEITLKVQSDMEDYSFLEMVGQLMLHCEEHGATVNGWSVTEDTL